SRCRPAASMLMDSAENFWPPGPRRPSARICLPVVVLYRPSTTAPPGSADTVSTYICEPVLLRSTRSTPVRRCSTFRTRRMSGPGGALVGRTHAACDEGGPAGPARKPSPEPSAVSDRLPKVARRRSTLEGYGQVLACRVVRWITPASTWPCSPHVPAV